MLMLRSIVLAINLNKQQGKNYSSGFLCSFYLASLTFGYLWYSSSTACAANDNSEKENTAGSDNIQDSHRIVGFTDQPSRVRKG